MDETFIIIGNGIAAITAVDAIREVNKEGVIHLFGDENRYPYNRVCLSKGLLGSLEEEKIQLRKEDWYKSKNVKLYIKKTIDAIDTDNKFVKLTNGHNIHYSKLLIATGAHNLIPQIEGIKKSGVASLRTFDNANYILEISKSMNCILIIGGGIQGLEMAWILAKLGKKVMVAELMDRLMPKQLDLAASSLLRLVIENSGIEILLKTQVAKVLGSDKVEGFLSKEGKAYACDGIIYSIGIIPNIELFNNTTIATNKGIIVNNQMETNIKNVYAAGDVAEFAGRIYGLCNIAIAQGKVAGENMVGKNKFYEHIVPVTTLNAFDTHLFSMGIVEDEQASQVLTEIDSTTNSYNKVLIKDKKVIGAIVLGDTKSSPIFKNAIEKEISLDGVDFGNISIDNLLNTIKSKKI